LPEPPLHLKDGQPARCRRYVGIRGHSRDGACGLAAQVVVEGQPLCYVHTPVAYRRDLWSTRLRRNIGRNESS
jgi:hypothetical protein